MYKRTPSGWFKHIDFIILDMVCVVIANITAYTIRHGSGIMASDSVYKSMFVVFSLLSCVVSVASSNFQGVLKRGYYQEFRKTGSQCVWVMLLGVLYLVFTKSADAYSRSTLLMMFVAYVYFAYFIRVIWKNLLLIHQKSAVKEESMLLVTTAERLGHVVAALEEERYVGYHISGLIVLDDDLVGQSFVDVPVVAGEDTMVSYVARAWVDEIFLDIPVTDDRAEELYRVFAKMGITVHLQLMHHSDIDRNRQFIERMGGYTVFTTSVTAISRSQLIWKRSFDIVGSIVGCMVTLVIALIIGPMIYIQSPGSILFVQERVGQNGRKFKFYKFRSMYLDAEARKQELLAQNEVADGKMFKMTHDPRIIGSEKGEGKGIGHFIRRYSLDEFPQFFNVLKGDMSLVGTRPPTVDEWEQYELHHRARLSTKPGITGLWQVSGRSDIKDFEEVVRLDMEYIANWSNGLDMKILAKTVKAVLGNDGAR